MTDRVDRFARGELSPAEARELAQEAVNNPELFAELTDVSLAKEAVAAKPLPGSRVIRFQRRAPWVAAAAAIAAGVTGTVLYVRSPRPIPRPALAFAAAAGQPGLLSRDLEPRRAEQAPVFRGADGAGREPRVSGNIVAVDGTEATVNLGSLDGVEKGSALALEPAGSFEPITVFREQTRGRITGVPKVQKGSPVRMPPATHLRVLLEKVDAAIGRGDPAAALRAAQAASEWAETAGVAAEDRHRALSRLAALEYQAGAVDAAERHFQAAADPLNLAVLRLQRGSYEGVEALLNAAVAASEKTGVAYAQAVNNLGALAEVHGDRGKAKALYAEALRTLTAIADAPGRDRQAIQRNLTRVQGSR